MFAFNIQDQTVAFPQTEIDKLLAAAANYYTANTPTASCVWSMQGTNMAAQSAQGYIDMAILIACYTNAGYNCTVNHTA